MDVVKTLLSESEVVLGVVVRKYKMDVAMITTYSKVDIHLMF
jgi:hypothetical protein